MRSRRGPPRAGVGSEVSRRRLRPLPHLPPWRAQVCVEVHPSWDAFFEFWQQQPGPKQLVGARVGPRKVAACLAALQQGLTASHPHDTKPSLPCRLLQVRQAALCGGRPVPTRDQHLAAVWRRDERAAAAGARGGHHAGENTHERSLRAQPQPGHQHGCVRGEQGCARGCTWGCRGGWLGFGQARWGWYGGARETGVHLPIRFTPEPCLVLCRHRRDGGAAPEGRRSAARGHVT